MDAVSYERALEAVRDRLPDKGAGHSERVADTAAELARVYGFDPAVARLAGVLHDWDRGRSAPDLLAAARDAGLTITPQDEAVPYLLHARTGAVGAREAFPGLSPEVAQAIARHTVGARDMTPLDQIVYIADMIEPARDFDGVESLREAVGEATLDGLFALSYQRSLLHLVEKRRRLHPDTVEIWNELVAGDR